MQRALSTDQINGSEGAKAKGTGSVLGDGADGQPGVNARSLNCGLRMTALNAPLGSQGEARRKCLFLRRRHRFA
jgi:hypothetical protein